MRGSRLATDRGVKACATRARSFECRGGSRKIIHSAGPWRELNASWSCSTRFTALYENAIQKPVLGSWTTGASRRSWSYAG